jgi:predicted O-methyltransferase YrrM
MPGGAAAAVRNPYLGAHETAALIELIASVRPRVMLEFGTNQGITAKAILDAQPQLERYIGIDVPWHYTPRLACQRSEVPYRPGNEAATDPRFKLLLRESGTLQAAELEPVDAVFIDGDHSEPGVLHDSALARALIRPHGIIAWHDYGNPAVEVTQALDRLAAQGWRISHLPGTWLAYLRS